MNLVFSVPGIPQPKERARRDPRGQFYTPEDTSGYEGKVKLYALQAMVRAHWPTRTKERCALTLRVHFPDARNRDLDNVFKAVADAMNKLVYVDDRQLFEMHVYKTIDSRTPRVEIEVTLLPSGSGEEASFP